MNDPTLSNEYSLHPTLTLVFTRPHDVDQYVAVRKLDEGFVGTSKYMGVAYFWDQRLKHLMRSASAIERVKVHTKFMENGVEFDKEQRCFLTTDVAYELVCDTMPSS